MDGLEVTFGSEIAPDFAVLFLQPLEFLWLSCAQTVDELVAEHSMLGSLATALCAACFLIRIEVISDNWLELEKSRGKAWLPRHKFKARSELVWPNYCGHLSVNQKGPEADGVSDCWAFS
jgi:hypothetical protein